MQHPSLFVLLIHQQRLTLLIVAPLDGCDNEAINQTQPTNIIGGVKNEKGI